MKLHKVLSLLIILSIVTTPLLGVTVPIDNLKGLERTPKADRIADGAHDIFQNVFIHYGNIEVVKGRDRLNTTAHSDTTSNGLFYYESQDGAIKKLIQAESTNLVSYNLDGTSRTVLASGLTNESWDAKQIGDTIYLTSSTNGLYKWTGAGSATAVGSVSAPASVNFSATSNVGGMTPGFDAVVVPFYSSTNLYWRGNTGSSSCTQNFTYISSTTTISSATNSTYKYKVTKFSNLYGIESEASSEDTASLAGSGTSTLLYTNCFPDFSDSACTTLATSTGKCSAANIIYSGKQTSASGTLAAAPSAPFNTYRIYRTVANGSDYFLLGEQSTGAYTDGKADNTLATPLDTTIDTIAPPSFKFIEDYKGVIFVAENDTIKFSKIPVNALTNADTYWLDTDELKVTGNITGLIKASDSLLIFTKNSIYQLTGFGVESFRLVPIIEGVGAINDKSIVLDTNGDVYFLSGTDGVYKLVIGQQRIDSLNGALISNKDARLTKLTTPNLDDVFRGEDDTVSLDPSDLVTSHAYYDTDNNLYHLFIKDFDLMFNALNNTWSYIPATKAISSVWRKSSNTDGVGVLLDNSGFFFNNWTGYENGIHSGTVTGVSTSSTNNTLTCSGCSFNTTGDGLKGLWIYIDNLVGEYRQISSNTATTITVSSNWSSNPITTDNFYIAYIIPEWRTKQYSISKIPQETIVSQLYINHNKSDSEQDLTVTAFQEKSDAAVNGFNDGTILDLSEKFINVVNTRMRSSWVQWAFKSFVYNTSNIINPPIDIISYTIEADSRDKVE